MNPFRVSECYRPRPVRSHGIRRADDWRLKVYSIVYGERPLDEAVYETGLAQVLAALPQPAVTPARPGVGFVIQHQGRGTHYLVLGWWDNENELPLRIFVRPFGDGQAWRPATASESVCVWDLQILAFEREAYVKQVLGRTPPEVEAYLEERFEDMTVPY